MMTMNLYEPPEMLNKIHPCSDIMSSLHFGPMLGEGAFAKVRLAKLEKWPYDKTNPGYFAVKCIRKKSYCTEMYNEIQDEIKILSKCSGIESVVPMHFVIEAGSTIFIGLEFCPGGDLETLVETQSIPRNNILNYLQQIASGLILLHKERIVYHDLKLSNVCIDAQGNAKLIDFGLAIILDDSMYNPETQRCEVITQGGTLEYSAPEIFKRMPHAFEADWWSFGVLVYKLLCGEFPYFIEGSSTLQHSLHICSSSSFHRNKAISEGSVEESFVEIFLRKDQKSRFGYELGHHSLSILLEHPFFLQGVV